VAGLDLSFSVLASFNITDSDRPSRHIKLMMSWPSSSVDIDKLDELVGDTEKVVSPGFVVNDTLVYYKV